MINVKPKTLKKKCLINLLITITCLLTSILNLRTPSGNNMLLHGIDINPMNPYEFIVYGDEEYIRSYDRRNMSYGPVKVFNYPTNIVSINLL